MSRKKKDSIILHSIKVEGLAAEGQALCHALLPTEAPGTTPRVMFVPYAAPGDVIDVLVTKRKKTFLEGRIERIVEPSPHRLEPKCPHFGVCGGCCFQTVPYEMQLEAKRQQVEDQFTRIGHLDFPGVKPTLPSERKFYYRNKLEFSASNKRWILPNENMDALTNSEREGLGFHIGRFFDKVLDIKECFLQKDPSNDIRLFVKNYCQTHSIPFYDFREHSGILRNIIIRTTETGNVMLIFSFAADFDGRCGLLDAVAAEFPAVTSLYYIINDKLNDSISDRECILYKGEDSIYEQMEDLSFRIGPKSFYQTNSLQAYRLYSVVREFAGLSGSELVYDLYTGTGTIAQFVSKKASHVIGIEYVPEAIEDAKDNAQRNGIANCEFFAGDMKDVLSDEFVGVHGRPDVLILDPPRAGVHPDVLDVILRAAPKRIVYVSCNPATQARDLAVLSSAYRIEEVQPVDMFPHTHHVENVCRLEKIEPAS